MSIATETRQRVVDYLRSHHVMTLATAGADGPDAAAVFYVNRDLDFYFLSAPSSRHCCNIQLDPRVAVTIHEDYSDWSAIKGLQMSAVVRQLEGVDIDAARTLFAAKFPDVPLLQGATGTVAQALLKAHWYGLCASRIRFIDNSCGFGHRTEWSRAAFTAGGDAMR